MKPVLIIIVSILIFCSVSVAQTSISLDHVNGLLAPDTIGTDQDISFHIRYTNNSGTNIWGTTNGFRFYSDDGAVWSIPDTSQTGALDSIMDGGQFLLFFGVDGTGADTIAHGSFQLLNDGMPIGFDSVVLIITTSFDSTQDGKTFCLDSSYYYPGGDWKWSFNNIIDEYFPDWDGPHCYTILKQLPTAVGDEQLQLPTQFALKQNYPNPFNPSTTIRFVLPKKSSYNLTVYNALGRTIKEFKGTNRAGEVSIDFDGSNLASGLYFYRLSTDRFQETKKMLLLK